MCGNTSIALPPFAQIPPITKFLYWTIFSLSLYNARVLSLNKRFPTFLFTFLCTYVQQVGSLNSFKKWPNCGQSFHCCVIWYSENCYMDYGHPAEDHQHHYRHHYPIISTILPLVGECAGLPTEDLPKRWKALWPGHRLAWRKKSDGSKQNMEVRHFVTAGS